MPFVGKLVLVLLGAASFFACGKTGGKALPRWEAPTEANGFHRVPDGRKVVCGCRYGDRRDEP